MADPTDPDFDPVAIFEDVQRRFLEGSNNLKNEVKKEGGLFGRILGTAVDFFKLGFDNVWSSFDTRLGWLFKPLHRLITGDLLTVHDEEIDAVFEVFQSLDMLDANDMKALRDSLQKFKSAGQVWGPILVMLMWFKILGSFGDVLGGTAMQNLNKKFSPMVPSPESVTRTSFIAPELHAQVVDAMKRGGLSEDDIKLLFVSAYTLESPQEIMQLFWRGELSKDGAINRMSELGYTPDRVAELMQLWERIPGLSDIVRYLGKEAFEPAMIRQFGLLDEYPRAETEKWAAKQGLDPIWAEKEWISHWRDIGVTQILAGLHRRITLRNGDRVDEKYVDDYLRLIEIPGPIRDIVQQTSYSPYTRVDARRMHDMKVLSDDELVGVYMDQGYDLDHATNMALFTIRYNQRDGKTFSASDIEKAYEDGDVSFSDAVTLLVEAGHDESYAGYLLSRVDLEKERAKRLDAAESVKAQYISNLINDTEVKNRLLGIGFTSQRASELVARWSALRVANAKLPSKTDLDKMLRHRIITEVEYRTEMNKLGYDERFVKWYLELVKSSQE